MVRMPRSRRRGWRNARDPSDQTALTSHSRRELAPPPCRSALSQLRQKLFRLRLVREGGAGTEQLLKQRPGIGGLAAAAQSDRQMILNARLLGRCGTRRIEISQGLFHVALRQQDPAKRVLDFRRVGRELKSALGRLACLRKIALLLIQPRKIVQRGWFLRT